MCEEVSGPEEIFHLPRKMWKLVFGMVKATGCHGPWRFTRFTKSGWSVSARPKATYGETDKGYHVFVSEKGALNYRGNLGGHVIPVYVKGEAIPFKNRKWYGSPYYKGYAVRYWRPA